MRLRFKRALAVLGCLSAPVAFAACSGKPDGDPEAGKALFSACAGCHALADAGSQGQAHINGIPVPNLDDSWRAARLAGIPDSTFEGIVREWIRIAELPMPRDILTGQDADDVAAYIASVAGRGPGGESPVRAPIPIPPDSPPEGPYGGQPEPPSGEEPVTTAVEQPAPPAQPPADTSDQPPAPPPADTSGQPPAPPQTGEQPSPPPSDTSGQETPTAEEPVPPQEIELDSDPGNQLIFTQTTLTAQAGEVTIRLNNEAAVPHNVAIRGPGVDTPPTEDISNGGSAVLTVQLEPGEYEFYCAVPGHEQAGMKGTLTVE